MKHPHHILAFDKSYFGDVGDGISPINISGLVEAATRSLVIARRHELETDSAFGQVLPYVVIRRADKVFSYRRTKMVGEERLAGKSSIGVGGHIDLADVIAHDSIINFVQTLANAVNREVREELVFSVNGVETTKPLSAPDVIGLINDTSDAVGQVHYGILMVLDVDADVDVECREDELVSIGFVDPVSMLVQDSESWTKLAAEFMA